METALLAMVAATMAMMGLLWVAMVGLYRQMGRMEAIMSFMSRHTHDKNPGRPVFSQGIGLMPVRKP